MLGWIIVDICTLVALPPGLWFTWKSRDPGWVGAFVSIIVTLWLMPIYYKISRDFVMLIVIGVFAIVGIMTMLVAEQLMFRQKLEEKEH